MSMAMEKIACVTPAGMPRRRISLTVSRWSLSVCRLMSKIDCHAVQFHEHRTAEMIWDSTVAIATPATRSQS